MVDFETTVPPSDLALTPEERLQRRLMARYYAQDRTAAKAPPPPPPGFIDDGSGATVTGASGIPDGSGGGPGKRNIPKNHPYDPKALKPLSRMLWAMSVSLGHSLAAYRQFTRLKSATISPDGMLGGRGYVMQVKEIRTKLHDACESLSTISDTIHDEINAPHWEPQMAKLPPEEAVDVRKFLDESKQILNNPEEDAEDDMEAISDSTGDGNESSEDTSEDEAVAEGDEVPAEATEEEALPEEGAAAEGEDETNLDESEDTSEDTAVDEGEGDEEESENPFDDQPDQEAPADEVPAEEAPAEDEVPTDDEGEPTTDEDEEEVPTEDGAEVPADEEAPAEDEGSDNPFDDQPDEPSEDEEVPEDPEAGEADEPPDAGEEESDLEEKDSDNPFDDQPDQPDEEETPSDDEDASQDDEEEDQSSPDDITEEDEAAADAALAGSGLPGAGEPPAKPLGNPKPKKKKKKVKFSPSPPSTETVQDQKFAPELRQASMHYRGNSSLPVDSLPGPRVNHLDRAEGGRGPLDSYNEDEPRVQDAYGLGDGASVKMSTDTHRTLKALVEKGWSEERILSSPMAKRLKLGKGHIDLANSSLPDDFDTETEGWDFGLGYGARGQGAGGYENPSGEGNGNKGVLGPTSGLPSDPGGGTVKVDTTPAVEGATSSSKSLMPTDVEAPVARSDYFNEGLSDEMIATSEMPSAPSIQYNYDRDLPNKSEMLDQQDTPYARYDYTTHNYRPDPVFSRPER